MNRHGRLSDEEIQKFMEIQKAANKERLKKRLIGWPLVVLAGAISFLVSVFARMGLSEVFGEESVIAFLGSLFVLFVAGYFFHQYFKDFWEKYLS